MTPNPYLSAQAGLAELDAYVEIQLGTTGPRCDLSRLMAAPQFWPYFRTGTRIQVTTTYPAPEVPWVRTGTVDVTDGWRPVFLLMHRAGDGGSSDTLGEHDRVTGVQTGRRGYRVLEGSS